MHLGSHYTRHPGSLLRPQSRHPTRNTRGRKSWEGLKQTGPAKVAKPPVPPSRLRGPRWRQVSSSSLPARTRLLSARPVAPPLGEQLRHQSSVWCGAVAGVAAPSPSNGPWVAAERVDMETSAPGKKPWWTVPENFHVPMVFYLEEGQEELIFGQSDTYLRCIEVHSYTLIQLESGFTATGQTRVTVVGPYSARQWLLHMMSHVISQDSYRQAQGLKMLERVRSQPLSKRDLETPMSMESDTGDLSLASRMSGTISLSVPEASPYRLAGCSGFHLSSLYWG
ncbi:KH homology domain-containing protein 1-like [Microcebus murinus]|uniref:KH homology domain-containing protein 1-like n=1 Tax=Microcebus murinus TaxID=30608 RepID=UPI003F6A8068